MPRSERLGNVTMGLDAVAFAHHPVTTKESRQAGFLQGEANRAAVGTGVGVTGLLPVMKQGLHGFEV